jgi:hypothetical protein
MDGQFFLHGVDDPIVLLGDGNLSASEAEANDVSLRAESATASGAGLFDSPETAIDSTTPAPPRSSDGWHDIDDFLEPAPGLRLAEQGASTPDSLPPHTPSSRPSSEPLHDSISTDSEATTSSSARPGSPPPRHCGALLETQLSQEGRLYTGRGVADEYGLVDPALDPLPFDKGAREQQEVEQEKDEDNDEDTSSNSKHPPSLQVASDPMAPMQLKVWSRASADRDTKTVVDDQPEGLQQEGKGVAAEPTAKRVGDTHLSGKVDGSPRPAEQQQLPPDREPSPATSRGGPGCDSYSRDGLNNTESDKDDEEPHHMKRKRSSSSQDGPMHKKPKHRLHQRPTGQQRQRSKPYRSSPKSHSPPDQASKVAVVLIPKARCSTPNATGTDVPPDYGNLDRSSRAVLPTLAEATFRPHSADCCSFTAVIHAEQGVSFSQLSRLIASIGHVGKIDDFTIKPMEQHSFLVAGFSRSTPSRLSSGGKAVSTAAGAGRTHKNPARPRPQHGKAMHAQPLASQGSEPSSSNDDGSLSDSDSDECSSEGEQGRSSTSKHSRWSDLDEQRLLAYKKEDKSWEWIFRKFPGRTGASIRTRWNMIRPRDE